MASSSSAVAGPPRQEMITSAISFLQDPKVGSSSIAQRIAFLESKGLTSQEIDEALRRSGLVGGGANGGGAGGGGGGPMIQQGPPQYHQQQQPYGQYGPPGYGQQQSGLGGRDWRDWFIMAVVSGTLGYGVIALARVSVRAQQTRRAHIILA